VTLSIAMLALADQTFFPTWAYQFLLALGLLTLLIGSLGGRGATVANRCLEHGNYNWWLVALAFLVSGVIIFEIICAVWLTVEYGVIESESISKQSDVFAVQLEQSVKSQLKSQPEAWWDWQKNFECCGYDNNTIPNELATGKFCTTDTFTSGPPCKDQLWADIDDQAIPLAVFMALFFIGQVVVLVSSVCLACVIQAQEPIYRD